MTHRWSDPRFVVDDLEGELARLQAERLTYKKEL
jgi:hypothetical protein